MKLRAVFWITQLCLFLLCGCVEDTSFETQSFENTLVIEAVITNELTNHVVLLSRTFNFTAENSNPETGATITVEGDGTMFSFSEISEGRYLSQSPFAAMPGIEYVLNIRTRNGESYSSAPETLMTPNPIERFYPERETNNEGDPVLSFFIESAVAQQDPTYFRYSFESTYKIVAPLYSSKELIVTNPSFPACDVELRDKLESTQVCFATQNSNEIFVGSSEGIATNVLDRQRLHSISTKDYIIAHRYSMLVKQHSITSDAHAFYESLKKFQENPSVFSQAQPGFVRGNIATNADVLVMGYFEVSNISSERVYANFVDFFPDVTIPSQVFDCEIVAPVHFDSRSLPPQEDCASLIPDYLREGTHVYFRGNIDQQFFISNGAFAPLDGPYDLVPIACGDCTLFGENVVPDFWEE